MRVNAVNGDPISSNNKVCEFKLDVHIFGVK